MASEKPQKDSVDPAESAGADGSSGQAGSTDQSWPGKAKAQSNTAEHWHPTDFGPGMGPDLSGREEERDSHPKEPKEETGSGKKKSIVHLAECILKYQVGDQCPNCGFAKLMLDPDEHISCPLCGYGARRACM